MTSRATRALVVAATLWTGGCGTVTRVDLGPTWVQGRGVWATLQGSTGLPLVAPSGQYAAFTVGAWLTAKKSGFESLGVLVGTQVGRVGGQRGALTDTEFQASARFQPRMGTQGLALGGGLSAGLGSSDVATTVQARPPDLFDPGPPKETREWSHGGVSVGVEVYRRMGDGVNALGPWRLDVPLTMQWITLYDGTPPVGSAAR